MTYGTIYLSGPMNTTEDESLFGVVAEKLKVHGLETRNPAGVEWGTTEFAQLPAEGMRVGMTELAQCESIFLMGEWRNARGCIAEVFMSALIGAKIYELDLGELLDNDVVRAREVDINRYNASDMVIYLLSQQASFLQEG